MAETYRIIVTSLAKKDINDILGYLQDNVSYQEAFDTRQAILSAIRKLVYVWRCTSADNQSLVNSDVMEKYLFDPPNAHF
ncbi:hypothetical protein, partial [Phaeodactylibacter sp.]|uniref:hypothetical protein n=1 Tax=Phaeodactylibacter sp. TaxID=1940289 RepID=UPI0025FBD002